MTDDLEGTEAARAQAVASIEELEQLVDSFSAVTRDVPELADVLSAMRLCVGALVTSRRLERTHLRGRRRQERYGAGATNVTASRVTAVCASRRPRAVAPVFREIRVCESTMPSRCAVVPKSACPETCQKTF